MLVRQFLFFFFGSLSEAQKCNLSDVQHFEVWEAGAKNEEDFLGDVYLDLYPRGISFIAVIHIFMFTDECFRRK
jgi:hypothetical protein